MAIIPESGSYVNTQGLPSLPIRSLNGYDEQFVINSIHAGASDFNIATELLVRLQDNNQYAHKNKGNIRYNDTRVENNDLRSILEQLSIGDQTALLLQTRKMTFGERLNMEFQCPSCHERNSVELGVSDLLQIQKSKSSIQYDLELDGYCIHLRPIRVADMATLTASTHLRNERNSTPNSIWTTSLIKTCIISSDPPLPQTISTELLHKIGLKLGKLDPIADLVLSMVCPHCNYSFQTPFFIEQYFIQEILMRQQQLDQEIHWLAFYYHWNEYEILSLPIKRRKKYVELIAETIYSEGS